MMTMFISLQANTENIRVVRGSQPAKLVVLSQVIGITVQPAVRNPSTETLFVASFVSALSAGVYTDATLCSQG